MNRTRTNRLFGRAAVAAALIALCHGHASVASPAPLKARADHNGLVLSLAVHSHPSFLVTKATLTNASQDPFQYMAGCVPPIVQVQARDESGGYVYGWQPPRVQCTAISPRTLEPGEKLVIKARFAVTGTTRVWALVSGGRPGHALFKTKRIKVVPQA